MLGLPALVNARLEESNRSRASSVLSSKMPTHINFSDVPPRVARDITTVLERLPSPDVDVWLPSTHEVSCVELKIGKGKQYPISAGSSIESPVSFHILEAP